MPPLVLHAGPLQLAFSPTEGSIRYLHVGEHEILRGISAPIRDETWATISPVISDLTVAQAENSFEVGFTARCCSLPIDFIWRGKISGAADGTLVFDFNGEALGDFRRNRIGFCVLHGSELSGRACAIEHGDGNREQGTFPNLIHWGAPFSDLRAIFHRVTPDLEAEVRLEGEVFEMEDQRNWSDASFKTYCTSLALPRPVFVAKGTRITQRVTVRLHGIAKKAPANFFPPWCAPDAVEVSVGPPLGWNLPSLGTRWNQLAPPSDAVLANLRALSFAHLRVDLWLNAPDYPDHLRSAANAADRLNLALEAAVFVDDDPTRQIAVLLGKLEVMSPAPRIARWLVFHQDREATPAGALIAVREALSASSFTAPVGGGSTDNYAELNQSPGVAAAGDFTTHACNPQVHAFDEASMIETTAQQGVTVANARHLSAGRPVIISPVTLTRRWRLNEAGAPTGLPARVMPFQNDARQDSPFATAWTLSSLSALARAGAASITYYETTGDNGLLRSNRELRPLGEVFAAIAPFSHGSVIATGVSHPFSIATLALEQNGRRVLLLANLRPEPQEVKIRGAWGIHTASLSSYGFSSISVS